MGATMGATVGCAAQATNACGCGSLQRYRNIKVSGQGGMLKRPGGRTVCLAVGFDYDGYRAEESSGLAPLAAVVECRRFADLARATGAEVLEYYDKAIPGCQGFPQKERVLHEWRRIGSSLGPDDTFVFFFAGHGFVAHGAQAADKSAEKKDGRAPDETLCFVEPDGSPNYLTDDEVSAALLCYFRPNTHVLFVTDTCHSGRVCDLRRPEFDGRPMCHLSAVRGRRHVEDSAEGGGFTCALLGTVEQLVREGETNFSVVDVYNVCYGRSEDWEEAQDFRLEVPKGYDPDTFAWPLVPPRGWEAQVPADKGASARVGDMILPVPDMVAQLMRTK